MKILYFFRALAVWGGIERVLVEKMNYLSTQYGFDIYMITTDQGSHSVPFKLASTVHVEDLNIRFHQQYKYPFIKRLLVANRLKSKFRLLIKNRIQLIKPDVIVCTTANYVDINILVNLKGNIPLVVESHSICLHTLRIRRLSNVYAYYMYRKAIAKARMIVTLTDGDAKEWRTLHSSVSVIPNMVNVGDVVPSTLTGKHVIFVGRFDDQKRPMEAIKIWQQVYPKFPDWHLDIYGEGEQFQEVKIKANQLGMNIHVHYPTEQIFECYCNSSILISTSLFEPFGLVLPEAMSCGLPVIAYDCPYGPSSIIVDGKNGFLVPLNNRTVFVNRLCQLMENYVLRKELGSEAMKITSRFSKNKIMLMWRNVFQELCPSQ